MPHLTLVTWALGDVLYEPGRTMVYLYFPTTAIVSLIYTMVDGTTAKMGMVGNEGVVGIALLMGGNTIPPGLTRPWSGVCESAVLVPMHGRKACTMLLPLGRPR